MLFTFGCANIRPVFPDLATVVPHKTLLTVFVVLTRAYFSDWLTLCLDNGRKLEVAAAFCVPKEHILKRSITKLNIPKSKSTGEGVSTVFTPL